MQLSHCELFGYCIWSIARIPVSVFTVFILFICVFLMTECAPIPRDPEDASTQLGKKHVKVKIQEEREERKSRVAAISNSAQLDLKDTNCEYSKEKGRKNRYMEYDLDNTTIIKQRSREAFLSLESESVIEPPLLNPQQKRIKWMERKNKGKKRKKDKKGKKNIPNAKEALSIAQNEINLGSVDNLRHQHSCKAQPFKQRIRIDGCITKTITNKFCHGTCVSFFIPKLQPRKLKIRPIFQSCSVCAPSEYDIIDVKLDCPDLDTKHIVRQVYKVKKCSCKALDIETDLPVGSENESETEMIYK